jgi:nucleoside-diphosphate-sugar epimerase
VSGVLLACEAPDVAGEMMNLATGGRISLNELACALNAIVGTNLPPIYRQPRAGDVRDSQADISKATRLLGYRPIVAFENGLAKTVEWCRSITPAEIPENPAA